MRNQNSLGINTKPFEKKCKKKKKKLAQFKPQKYLCILKKELSEKVAGGEAWCQAARAASCSGFCTLFSSVFGDLDRLQNSGLRSNSGCVSDYRKARSGMMGQV